MDFGAPTWPSKPHSKFNLALLGSLFGAVATLRIELSPRRELNSHGSGIFAVQTLLDCNFTPVWPQFGRLGRRLGPTWTLLGASWAQHGASWAPLGRNLKPLRRLLDPTWRLLSSTWRLLGATLELLGATLELLGATCQPSGATLRPLAAFWGQLGASRATFGSNLKLLRMFFDFTWQLKPIATKQQLK